VVNPLRAGSQRPLAAAVYLARHGETASNTRGRYAGQSAESLTAPGRAQVLRLADQLHDHALEEIWTSNIRRAVESAELLGARFRVPIHVEQRLTEIRMGPWEGLTEKEVAAAYPAAYKLWQQRPDRLRLRGRETLGKVGRRVTAVLAEARARSGGVLLVTHVAPIRVALLTTVGLPLSWYQQVPVANADCFVISGTPPFVRRLNRTESFFDDLDLAVSG